MNKLVVGGVILVLGYYAYKKGLFGKKPESSGNGSGGGGGAPSGSGTVTGINGTIFPSMGHVPIIQTSGKGSSNIPYSISQFINVKRPAKLTVASSRG